jgi:hypothetical protein
MAPLRLINWLWLEDLLVEAIRGEVESFAREHRSERFYALCLEYDPADGSFALAYNTREAADQSIQSLSEGEEYEVCCRAVELLPDYFHYRRVPAADRDGFWSAAMERLEPYREAMSPDTEPEVVQFLWVRFEKLLEDSLRRLLERDGFRRLSQELEFLAYSTTERESLEELEDRLVRLYPTYRRATMEQSEGVRYGLRRPRRCKTEGCDASAKENRLLRCTYCQAWLCDACWEAHRHPELNVPQPLFSS